MAALNIPDLLSKLTLEEKAALCTGQTNWHTAAVERLGIPSMMMTDGPHGLRKQKGSHGELGILESEPATCFPSAAGLGSTWDRELLGKVGEALGVETAAHSVGVLLGPGINLKRTPLCGRNFEYFSEDPYLTGQMAAPLITGVQSKGVGTSVKHYAANNQETDRMTISVEVDERTLREVYLRPFEHVVRETQPWTIMCSYNQINGTFAAENHWLLTEVLRDDWGFDGLVVSDWGAVNDRPTAIAAGLDLEMPSSNGNGPRLVVDAVNNGTLSMQELDLAVTRVLEMVARATATPVPADYDAHHALARVAAAQAAVLLKNEGDVLPLAEGSFADDAVVIGELARTPRYQGSGSSQVNPTKLVSLLQALADRGIDAAFAPGYHLAEAGDAPGQELSEDELRSQAVELARGKTVVLSLGLPATEESEGFDRAHMDLPAAQIDLLSAVSEVAQAVIVLLSNGATVVMNDWAGKADAIVELWLGGQAGGEGAADLLLGDIAPSGRLSESIPVKLSDLPAQLNFPGESNVVRYGEGPFIGYRGLDAMDAAVTYPFGHGLTYTTFAYENLLVEATPVTADTPMDAEVVRVSLTVRNTGSREGVAVPQIYIGRPDSELRRAPRELAGFERITLAPGASAKVEFSINRREISHWAIDRSEWAVEPGALRVYAGASSRDLPLQADVTIDAPALPITLRRETAIGHWFRHPAAAAELIEILDSDSDLLNPEGNDPMTAGLLQGIPIYKLPSMGLAHRLSLEKIDELVEKYSD